MWSLIGLPLDRTPRLDDDTGQLGNQPAFSCWGFSHQSCKRRVPGVGKHGLGGHLDTESLAMGRRDTRDVATAGA